MPICILQTGISRGINLFGLFWQQDVIDDVNHTI